MKKLFSLLFIVSLLISCSAEQDYISQTEGSIKKQNVNISFNEFKDETKLYDFKKTLKITSNNYYSRNADGSYELSDFDIDTDIIKRLELDEKVTYTFRIYPKVIISPKSIYNLTLTFVDGEWLQNVIELKPTTQNFDTFLTGESSDIDGKMSILYTSNLSSLSSQNSCYKVEIIGNVCENANVISDECTIKKNSYFCFEGSNINWGLESDIIEDSTIGEADFSFVYNTNDLKKNLRDYAINTKNIVTEINEVLLNSDDFTLEELSDSDFNGITNENELINLFQSKGADNASYLVSLLKSQANNTELFLQNNRDFLALEESTRTRILDEFFTLEFVDENEQQILARTCREEWNIATGRCNRDHAIQSTIAVIGTFATGGWGLLAVGGVLIVYRNCLSDALQDYRDCQSSQQ